MDDKGQVYFGADDKEVPEEDAARLKEALEADFRKLAERAEERARIGGESGERFYCRTLRVNPGPDDAPPWIPEGADLDQPFEAQADEEDRPGEQEA